MGPELYWRPNLSHPAFNTENSTIYNETFYDLEPNTLYAFRMSVKYKSNETFVWPEDTQYSFKTSGNKEMHL